MAWLPDVTLAQAILVVGLALVYLLYLKWRDG